MSNLPVKLTGRNSLSLRDLQRVADMAAADPPNGGRFNTFSRTQKGVFSRTRPGAPYPFEISVLDAETPSKEAFKPHAAVRPGRVITPKIELEWIGAGEDTAENSTDFVRVGALSATKKQSVCLFADGDGVDNLQISVELVDDEKIEEKKAAHVNLFYFLELARWEHLDGLDQPGTLIPLWTAGDIHIKPLASYVYDKPSMVGQHFGMVREIQLFDSDNLPKYNDGNIEAQFVIDNGTVYLPRGEESKKWAGLIEKAALVTERPDILKPTVEKGVVLLTHHDEQVKKPSHVEGEVVEGFAKYAQDCGYGDPYKWGVEKGVIKLPGATNHRPSAVAPPEWQSSSSAFEAEPGLLRGVESISSQEFAKLSPDDFPAAVPTQAGGAPAPSLFGYIEDGVIHLSTAAYNDAAPESKRDRLGLIRSLQVMSAVPWEPSQGEGNSPQKFSGPGYISDGNIYLALARYKGLYSGADGWQDDPSVAPLPGLIKGIKLLDSGSGGGVSAEIVDGVITLTLPLLNR